MVIIEESLATTELLSIVTRFVLLSVMFFMVTSLNISVELYASMAAPLMSIIVHYTQENVETA